MAARRFSGQAERRLCGEYEDGATTQALADKYGTERITVAKTLRRNGIKPRGARGRKARPLSERDEAEIVRRYRARESTTAIALAFGTHYGRITLLLKRHGVHRPKHKQGNWRGGRSVTPNGYVVVQAEKDDPIGLAMASTIGYVMEHRLVMARHLGRPLETRETVHHIDGNRTDNRLENLQLRSGRHGNGAVLRCRSCGSNDIEAAELAQG